VKRELKDAVAALDNYASITVSNDVEVECASGVELLVLVVSSASWLSVLSAMSVGVGAVDAGQSRWTVRVRLNSVDSGPQNPIFD